MTTPKNPDAARARPRRTPSPLPREPVPTAARVPAAPTAQAHARADAEALGPAYAVPARTLDFDGPFDTAMFHDLAALRALTAQHRDLAIPSLVVARGYEPATLFALAEVGHHYVLSGGTRLALVIFEGLTAVAPREPYFALALGYTLDRAGRTDEAIAAYRRAMALAPGDGRAELNLAELLLAAGDPVGARHHLRGAERAASARQDHPLALKARAILSRVG